MLFGSNKPNTPQDLFSQIGNGFIQTAKEIVDWVGDRVNDCIMALGSFLDNITAGIRGMGKSEPVSMGGFLSKLNPMNMFASEPSPSMAPVPEPKLGRNAALHHREMGLNTLSKYSEPTISMPTKFMGQLGDIKNQLSASGCLFTGGEAIAAPSCQHFGTSMARASSMAMAH